MALGISSDLNSASRQRRPFLLLLVPPVDTPTPGDLLRGSDCPDITIRVYGDVEGTAYLLFPFDLAFVALGIPGGFAAHRCYENRPFNGLF